jgi:type II secretory pathway predicted ATPase ExeA
MYTEFYRLSEKPFEDVLDPRFFYRTRDCQKSFTSMLTWAKQGHGFALVTGEAGTGKTLFVQTLLSHFEEKTRTVFIPNPAATFKEMLTQILRSVEDRSLEDRSFEDRSPEQPVREETQTALLRRFMRYLRQLGEQGETFVIVLDECQDLSRQVLEDVQHFLGPKSKPVRTILVGQPGLESLLESAGLNRLRQAISIRVRTMAFSKEESLGYMAWRLRAAGGRIRLFTPKAVSLIFRYSGGVPGLVNHVCDNALRSGFAMNLKEIDVDLIEKTIRNLDGPETPEQVLSPETGRRRKSTGLLSRNFPVRMVFIGFLLLGCFGGFVLLLNLYVEHGRVKPWQKEGSLEQGPVSHILPEEPPQPVSDQPVKTETEPRADERSTVPPLPSVTVISDTPPPPLGSQGKTVVVKPGQYLFSLAKAYYQDANPTLVDLVLSANPEITNAHQILVNQRVLIPAITEDLLLIPSPGRTFRIHLGTFLRHETPRVYSTEEILKGKQIEMIPRKVSSNENWYRVVVGTFENRDEALAIVSRLKGKGLLPLFGGKLSPEQPSVAQ